MKKHCHHKMKYEMKDEDHDIKENLESERKQNKNVHSVSLWTLHGKK